MSLILLTLDVADVVLRLSYRALRWGTQGVYYLAFARRPTPEEQRRSAPATVADVERLERLVQQLLVARSVVGPHVTQATHAGNID